MGGTRRVRNNPGIYSYETKAGRRYAVVVTEGGRQRWRQGFRTLEEAREARQRLVGYGSAPASLTLRVYLEEQWLPSLDRSPRTLSAYRNAVRHIVAEIGNLRLAKLEPLHLEQLKAGLRRRGLGPTSVHLFFNVLKQALRQAVRWGLLSRNPASRDYVAAPQRAKRTPPLVELATDELLERVGAVVRSAEAHGHGLLVKLALLTGLRASELFGLEWRAVDFGRGLIRVSRATTKTQAGARDVALDEGTLEELRRHRMEQMRVFGVAGTHVFMRPDGRRWAQNVFWRDWDVIRRAAGEPGLHFHDLRHVHATLLAREDVAVKVLQARLGHADVSTTLNVYTHVNVEDQRAGARRLAARLRESLGKRPE